MKTHYLRRLWTLTMLVLLVVALGVSPLLAQDSLPREETLVIAGFQWGPPTTFNPLANPATWPAGGQHKLIFETLFGFNVATGGLDPVLASDVTYTDATTAVVTLQDGTRWQDGTDLTVDDVLFTFNLAKDHADLPYSTFWSWVTEMNATGDRTIEIKLNPDQLNPGQVNNWLTSVRILPQHIWEERAAGETSLTQVVDDAPVGSGPFTVFDFSTERVVLERFDDYWAAELYGLPAPRYILHPIFGSNDEANLAFQRGEVDISQTFSPQIWQMWEDEGLPVGTWYAEEPYHIPGSIPVLHVNTHKPGLENLAVRRALAHAINYPQIAAVAMSRYSVPAQASLVLPTGGESQFFNADAVAETGWEYNPDEARRILEEEAGATLGSDGIYVLPDGTRLGPYTAMATFGWTDWVAAIELVAQSATESGIEVVTEFPEFPIINARRNNGDFDLIIWSIGAASPATPWQRFRDALDMRGVADFGEPAFWNWGRFEHPDVPALLDAAGASTDDAEKAELFGQLDAIYRENIPVIPLMYRPLEFYEFNETHWTGFPTAEDPFAAPQPERSLPAIIRNIQPVQ
jgi:peptide/nickel transport system substrate-binding protein